MPQIYSATEVMPKKKDIEKIITAKMSYDKAKQEKAPRDFDTWINSEQIFYKVAPRGLAYTASQKSYTNYVNKCRQNLWNVPKSSAPTALKYYVIAAAIGWHELIDEMKKTVYPDSLF